MEPLGKRRVPRREIEARVGVLLKGHYFLAQAHEIGEGGMLLSTPTKIAKDEQVVITLRIPEVLSGVVLGTVIYQTPDGRYGVAFDKIEFEVKRKIRNFVASSTTGQLKAGGAS